MNRTNKYYTFTRLSKKEIHYCKENGISIKDFQRVKAEETKEYIIPATSFPEEELMYLLSRGDMEIINCKDWQK